MWSKKMGCAVVVILILGILVAGCTNAIVKLAEFRSAYIPTETGFTDDVELWREDVIGALAANDLDTSPEMVEKVLRQIASESGGNPYAIQRIWDVNSGKAITFNEGVCPWCAVTEGVSCGDTNVGHGLLQTIPTTFWENCFEGHEDIFNGYDNLLAGLHYAKHAYGEDLDGLGEGHGF